MAEVKPIPNQRLRYERERRAWSQLEVADRVGTTPDNVGRWERGVTSPGPHFRQKLCEVFEKNPQELGLVPNQKLRHERERRAWSQLEVADRVGTTPDNVGQWERGVT